MRHRFFGAHRELRGGLVLALLLFGALPSWAGEEPPGLPSTQRRAPRPSIGGAALFGLGSQRSFLASLQLSQIWGEGTLHLGPMDLGVGVHFASDRPFAVARRLYRRLALLGRFGVAFPGPGSARIHVGLLGGVSAFDDGRSDAVTEGGLGQYLMLTTGTLRGALVLGLRVEGQQWFRGGKVDHHLGASLVLGASR